MYVKKDDQANEKNLEECKRILKQSTAAIKNFEALDATIHIPDIEKWHSRVQKKVIPRQVVFRLMNELFPTKMDTNGIERKADYTGADSHEFQKIYDGVNEFTEAPEFDLQLVQEALDNPSINSERKKFLNKVLVLYELSKKKKISNNEALWKKEIQKEFEKKQHEAILAMHFLKLKDYYPDRNMEKFAEKLMKAKASRATLDVLKTKVRTDKEALEDEKIR